MTYEPKPYDKIDWARHGGGLLLPKFSDARPRATAISSRFGAVNTTSYDN